MINKNNKFYELFQSEGKKHFKNIFLVNKKKFHHGWGSYLFNGKKYVYDESMYKKQKLLFDLSKKNNKILEIGVYMGHSILIMLLANPKINITAIDISGTYSKPSINYLKKNFPEAKINLIIGDSREKIVNLKEKFDLIHIDSSHSLKASLEEFDLIIKLKKENILKILFDDIESIIPLKNNILKSFNIQKTISSNCKNKNFYLEFKIDNNKFQKEILFYKFLNLKIYFFYFPLKYLLRIFKLSKIQKKIDNYFYKENVLTCNK
jgi:hypothetical protein